MNLKTHFYTVFLELFSLAETEVGCGCTAFVHFQKYLLYIDDIHVFQRSPLIHYQTENKFYNLCLRSSKLRSIFASLKPSSLLLNVKLFIFRSTTLSIEVTFLIWAFSRRIPVKNSSSIRNPSISVRSLSSWIRNKAKNWLVFGRRSWFWLYCKKLLPSLFNQVAWPLQDGGMSDGGYIAIVFAYLPVYFTGW